MSKRGTRYVYIEGQIWRFTDRQYRQYLAANVHRFAPVSSYGRFVGFGINVTRFEPSDFQEALRAHSEASGDTRDPQDDTNAASPEENL